MRFVLVHGGLHGAWCWKYLIPELAARGHAAIAIDLPGHGERVNEEASLAGYRDAIAEAIEPGDILVGHSAGGFFASLGADAAIDRVRHIVYLAGGLPIEGLPMHAAGAGIQADRRIAELVEVIDNGRRMSFRSPEGAVEFFYHDCSPEMASWACSMLTPEPLAPMLEPISVPRLWAAQLPRSLIMCRQDRTGKTETAPLTAARLGVEPLWIDSSHSPFLSQPAALADLIIAATRRPPIGPLLPR